MQEYTTYISVLRADGSVATMTVDRKGTVDGARHSEPMLAMHIDGELVISKGGRLFVESSGEELYLGP